MNTSLAAAMILLGDKTLPSCTIQMSVDWKAILAGFMPLCVNIGNMNFTGMTGKPRTTAKAACQMSEQ